MAAESQVCSAGKEGCTLRGNHGHGILHPVECVRIAELLMSRELTITEADYLKDVIDSRVR